MRLDLLVLDPGLHKPSQSLFVKTGKCSLGKLSQHSLLAGEVAGAANDLPASTPHALHDSGHHCDQTSALSSQYMNRDSPGRWKTKYLFYLHSSRLGVHIGMREDKTEMNVIDNICQRNTKKLPQGTVPPGAK